MLQPTPPTDQISDSHGVLVPLWQAFLSGVGYYLRPVGQSGPTSSRPVNTSLIPLYVGQPYFDTTLGHAIWVQTANPVIWVDAQGNIV